MPVLFWIIDFFVFGGPPLSLAPVAVYILDDLIVS